MIKGTLGLAGALAAAMALTVPAISSAEWTDNTVNVPEHRNITVEGSLGFTGALGGLSCSQIVGNGTLIPGTTGQLQSYEIINPKTTCKATGLLAGCTVVSAVSTGLPWPIHTNGSVMTTPELHFHKTFSGAFCPYHELTLKGSTTTTPDNLHAATSGTVAGTLAAYNGTTGAFIQNVFVTGAGTITPSGTYGLT